MACFGFNSSGFNIAGDCNINTNSSSYLGYYGSFKLPYYLQPESNEASSFLAGSKHFKVLEIEVFKLEKLKYKWFLI